MQIDTFEPEHLAAAAALLADVHSTKDGGVPASALTVSSAAQAAIEAAMTAGLGVVALEEGVVVGYMIAPLPPTPGSESARLTPACHAAGTNDQRHIYRRLYEGIAGRLAALGFTNHSIPVPTHLSEAVRALFELEFSLFQIKGAVPVPAATHPQGLGGRIRSATPDEIGDLLALAIELQKYHARSPMLQAALLPVPAIRDDLGRSIDDDSTAVLVAESDGELVGMLQAQPDGNYMSSVQIGMNVVTETARSAGVGTNMYEALLRWAAAKGYQYCTVGWTSANLVSDAFYRSKGFKPIRYRLHRRLDPRVTWANESLDYSSFPASP